MAACAAVAAEQRHRRSPAALPPGPQGFAAERRPRNMDVVSPTNFTTSLMLLFLCVLAPCPPTISHLPVANETDCFHLCNLPLIFQNL